MGLNRFGDPIEAKIVREYLQEIDIQQEFSHVATPQDNGHIDRVAGAILSCYYQKSRV